MNSLLRSFFLPVFVKKLLCVCPAGENKQLFLEFETFISI